MKKDKPIQLSNSAVDKYETCPRMYKYHYIDKIRSNRESSALLFGSAVDEALNDLIQNKDINQSMNIFHDMMKDWEKSEDIDFFKKDYDEVSIPPQVLEGLQEDEIPWNSLYYKGIEFLNSFQEQILPKIKKCISVQEKISLENQYGDTIIGYIDCILELDDGNIYIIDNKTSNSSYSQKKIEESQQLHLYSRAKGIDKIGYIVLRKDYNKKGLMRPIQVLLHEADQDFCDKVFERFDNVLHSIKEGEFPKTEKSFTCKNHFGKPCVYYDLCHNMKKVKQCPDLVDLKENKNERT